MALVYTVTANVNGGETLTAFKGAGGPEIFTLTLDPTSSNGSYTFTLMGPLDDAAHSDSISLGFTVQATDADGDPVNTSFNVSIADDQPTDSSISTKTVGEEGLSFANHNVNGEAQNASVTTSLNINWGADQNNPTTGGGLDDRSVAFASTMVSTLNNLHLTSNGQALSYSIGTAANGDALLTATAGSDHHTVFTVELSDANNGSYTFTLADNLDHPSSSTAENTLSISFNVVATDSDGDSVNQSFTVNVQDDVPVVTGTVAAQTVGEEGLSFGNHLQPNESQVASTGDISLKISWGADQNNPTAGSGTHDRSVAFASNTISGLNNLNLTSNGQTLHYAISQDATGALLTATAASDNHTVFTVQLSDANNGTYNFTLADNLDHPNVQGGNLDSFTFNVVATDSDGDTVSQTFGVNVQDDIPVVTAVAAQTVGEEGLSFGNHHVNGEAQNASTGDISLNISWGADQNNPTAGSGAHDRSVAFASGTTTALAALNLTSNGQALSYAITQNATGALLTATAGSDNHTVFTVQLSDASNGTYNFTLFDNLDHPAGLGANLDSFTFNLVATDSDGDTVSQSFAVNVQDDIPVVTAVTAQTVGEEGLSFGNHHQPNEAQNASTGNVSLNISWGADQNNPTAGGGAHDRSVAFASNTVSGLQGLHLTSNGQALSYAITQDATGALLTATAGSDNHTVFTVQLSRSPRTAPTISRSPTISTIRSCRAAISVSPSRSTWWRPIPTAIRSTSRLWSTCRISVTLPVAGVGTEDTVKEANLLDGSSPDIHALSQVTDSLNVSWGADQNDSGNIANRSVSFQHATASADVQVTDVNGHAITGLTSNGATVQYGIFNGVLVGYTNGDPLFHQVFTVSLNDNGSTGSYTFTLLNNLDHPAGNGSNTLNFTFDYTADRQRRRHFEQLARLHRHGAGCLTCRPPMSATPARSTKPICRTAISRWCSVWCRSAGFTGDLNITWGADNNPSTSSTRAIGRSVSFTNNSNAALDVHRNLDRSGYAPDHDDRRTDLGWPDDQLRLPQRRTGRLHRQRIRIYATHGVHGHAVGARRRLLQLHPARQPG